MSVQRGSVLELARRGRVHVVGASSAEGAALLLFLAGDLGIEGIVGHDFAADERSFARSFRRANTAWDRPAREERLRRLRQLPIERRLGERYLEGIDEADLILASQNWFNYAPNLPALPDAVRAGARLAGVVDVAMDLFDGTRVGVTGSNGKSTTAALTVHLLRAGLPEGRRVLQGGNDRDRQVSLQELQEASSDDVLVWEVSNRHLRDRPVWVDVAVLTNVTRNHIEDHGSWEAYVEAKARLLSGPGEGGHVITSARDHESLILAARLQTDATRWTFGEPGNGAGSWVDADGALWVRAPAEQPQRCGEAAELVLPGPHNRLNLAAAAAAATAAGARPERFAGALATFGGLPGRLELVAEANDVRWIYDVQATTAPAAAAGLEALGPAGRPLVLIVGGHDKGMDFGPMADRAARWAKAVVALPGDGAAAFLHSLDNRVPVHPCDDLDSALLRCRALSAPGDTVLLSPGCAFFHRDFIANGGSFASRVRALLT